MPSVMYTYQRLPGLIADLPQLRSMNIDVVMNYSNNDTLTTAEHHIDYLDALQSAGLKAYVDIRYYAMRLAPDYTNIGLLVNALKDHPALYGWYMADEPTAAGFPLAQRNSVYSYIKGIDPLHPVWEVYPGYGAAWWPAGSGETASVYADTPHDIFSIDNYPVTSRSWNNATFVSQIAGSFNNLTVADRSRTMGIVQAYGGGAGLIVPLAADITTMSNGYAASGWNAEGIAFWMWKIEDGLYPPLAGATWLKDTPTSWTTVTEAANGYHEDLYPAGTNPTSVVSIFFSNFELPLLVETTGATLTITPGASIASASTKTPSSNLLVTLSINTAIGSSSCASIATGSSLMVASSINTEGFTTASSTSVGQLLLVGLGMSTGSASSELASLSSALNMEVGLSEGSCSSLVYSSNSCIELQVGSSAGSCNSTSFADSSYLQLQIGEAYGNYVNEGTSNISSGIYLQDSLGRIFQFKSLDNKYYNLKLN